MPDSATTNPLAQYRLRIAIAVAVIVTVGFLLVDSDDSPPESEGEQEVAADGAYLPRNYDDGDLPRRPSYSRSDTPSGLPGDRLNLFIVGTSANGFEATDEQRQRLFNNTEFGLNPIAPELSPFPPENSD